MLTSINFIALFGIKHYEKLIPTSTNSFSLVICEIGFEYKKKLRK